MYLAFLYAYFIWIAVQNLVLPWAYQQGLVSAVTVGVLMAGKEVALVIALLALAYRAFQKGWRFNTPDKFALGYLAVLTFYLCLGPQLIGSTVPFSIRAISMRALISLVLFYFWGRLSFLEFGELRKLLLFVLGLQVATAAFGSFEWALLPTSFWSNTVGSGTFMLDVKGLLEGQNVIDGLPSNMFRFGVRRLISTYGDPLAMGIASVFPLLACAAVILQRKGTGSAESLRKWAVWTGVIGAALLLTIGRESIGAAVLGIAILFWWSGKLKNIAVPVAVVAVALLFVPQVWTWVSDTFTFREESAATHLNLIYAGWERVPEMVVGKGLGEAGGWAYSLAGVESEVGENSYFELMAQTGLLSVLLLLGFLASFARLALWYGRKFPDLIVSAGFIAAAAHIVARSVMAMFSPSLFGVIPLASFFFFCGAGFTTMQRMGVRPGVKVLRAVLVRRPLIAGASPSPAGGTA
jgi:hypothetical protein